jgi:hypothetical protein
VATDRSPGASTRQDVCWSARAWVGGFCVRIIIFGVTVESCMPSGQWNVEELFRRAKKGGIASWCPSHQWADNSLHLHTFATVVGLMLVSLARLMLGNRKSAQSTMKTLAEVKATLARVGTKERGRRATVMLAPDVTAEQRKAIKVFELERWMPTLLSSMHQDVATPVKRPTA